MNFIHNLEKLLSCIWVLLFLFFSLIIDEFRDWFRVKSRLLKIFSLLCHEKLKRKNSREISSLNPELLVRPHSLTKFLIPSSYSLYICCISEKYFAILNLFIEKQHFVLSKYFILARK